MILQGHDGEHPRGWQESVKLHRKTPPQIWVSRRLVGRPDRDPVAVRRAEPVFFADPQSGRSGAEGWPSRVTDDFPGLKRHGIDPQDRKWAGAALLCVGSAGPQVWHGVALSRGVEEAIRSPAQIVRMESGLDDSPVPWPVPCCA